MEFKYAHNICRDGLSNRFDKDIFVPRGHILLALVNENLPQMLLGGLKVPLVHPPLGHRQAQVLGFKGLL